MSIGEANRISGVPSVATIAGGANALGTQWEATLKSDGQDPLPRGWKSPSTIVPKGTDADNRLKSLKTEEGLDPTIVYKNPKDGTFALYSQTEGESDARVYVFTKTGKEVWHIDVGDDGTITGQPATPVKPLTPPPGKRDSLKGNLAAIAQIKDGVDGSQYTNANWVEVPKNKLSQTWTPEESARLPELVLIQARKMDRLGLDPTVSKLVIAKHPVYVIHTQPGWKDDPDNAKAICSDQKAWVFDETGNLLASGLRRVSSADPRYANLRNCTEAVGPYNWAAKPSLPV